MNGFVALCPDDGAPVDRDRLEDMAAFLAAGRAGAHTIGGTGSIGLGLSPGRRPGDTGRERPPLTLGQDIWLVADARIDGRAELARKLGLAASGEATRLSDHTLILHAYLQWGERCVDHLLGDYSFVVWDGRTHRLFAARDPFGVRPLYYARAGRTWIFSNRLDCLRLHPDLPDRLNETAVLDFLLLGCNQELDTTVFAAIRRVPPAHCLTLGGGTLAVRRHWQVPEPDLRWQKRDEDYLDPFRALLAQATADRRPTDRAAIWLSGGLDSTSLAAAGTRGSPPASLAAVTVVYDRLFPDRERHFASRAAQALGLDVEFIVADDIPLYDGWERPDRRTAEPQGGALAGVNWRIYEAAARLSPIVWTGEGGDEILPTWTVRQLARHLPPSDLGRCVGTSLLRHHRIPPLGTGLLNTVRRWTRPANADLPHFPVWLAREFAEQPGWRERFEVGRDPERTRPTGRCGSRFYPAPWSQLLEDYADKGSRCGVEVALPYLDLRLVDFALRLPPFPWAAHKHLLRRLGRGVLPDEILDRPKTGLAGDPCARRLETPAAWRALEERVPLPPELEEYVATARLREAYDAAPQSVWATWTNLRAFDLAAWLHNGRRRPARPGSDRTRAPSAPEQPSSR